MLGILANPFAIVLGACVGLLFKKAVTETLAQRTEQALGFCTLIIGIRMALKFENVLLLIFCVSLGGILGTLLRIEERTERLAAAVQARFSRSRSREGNGGGFALAFSTSSILFCTGAMAVVGSINSGVSGDHEVLFAKSLIDGLISVSFGAVYGVGVAFSAIPVLLYQGGIAALASQLKALADPRVLNEISGVGGALLAMIGVSLSGIKKVSVADFLPAIPLAILAALVWAQKG